MADFREFLKQHKVDKGAPFTHTCMAGGGGFFVGEDEMDTFYELYVEHIENNLGSLHLTEKSTPIGPPRVDLDFIYKKEVTKHQHTQEQTLAFIKAYMAELARLVELPESVEVFVMEKPKPTLDNKERSKSGLHLLVPNVFVNKYVESTIKRNLLPRMPEFFPNLPLEEPWDKIYDSQPLNHTAQWTLLGSLKKDSLPYKIQYIVDWTRDEMSVDNTKPAFTPALVKKLSVCTPTAEPTPYTALGKETYESVPLEAGSDRISGGRAVTPARGRQAQRGPPGSRGSSPGAIVQRPLTEEERTFIQAHVKNLAAFRADNYEEWVRVGICLKNIHIDLLETFLDFSSQCSSKYNERECIRRWDSLTYKSDGQRIEMGTLLYWSRLDNPEGYEKIRDQHIESLVDVAASGTEYDVARVVHAKFRDTYKCVKFGNNVWYRFTGHIWEETERGVDLQCKLSSDIWKLFLRREKSFINVLETMDDCGHKKQERDMGCAFCRTAKMKESMSTVCLNLKKTKFKENVMKECKELFLDEQFALRADETKHLIAFNNGIYDTSTFEFRAGRPEDYITFSTRIDYDPELPHEAHACWPEVKAFLDSVLPDVVIRDHFLKHLSTLLIGGNEAQKFHILTGTGSNGKSLLMNLVTTTLGDYACNVNISLLTQGRQKVGSAAPDIVRIKGRRMVTMQEPDEGVALNTGLMKELASGEKISARDLYAGSKAMIDFVVQAKFHLACNEKPKIQTTDGGTWRRLAVIPFPAKFVANPKEPHEKLIDESLQHKVVSEAWAKCFLSFMVHTLEQGKGWRKLQPPEAVMQYTNEYQSENDVLARFMQEHVRGVDTILDDAPYPELITKAELARQFKEWKRVNDVFKGTVQDLVKRMETKFGRYPKDGWASFRLERLL